MNFRVVTLGHKITRRRSWGPGPRPLRPLFAYERRRPYTCGICDRRVFNGNLCCTA